MHKSGDDLDICALNLPPFYTSSITGDLFITQLNINTPHYDQESPKRVDKLLVIILACQRRFDCYRQKVPSTKKHIKKNKKQHVNIIEIATVSVDVSLN